jgi:hypothetical protein
LVNIDKIKSVFLYDIEDSSIITYLDIVDPLQGKILSIAEDEDVGDYTDPVQGRDITIETTDAAANGTGYNQSKVRVRTKTTPLSDSAADVEKWLTLQPDALSIFKKYTYEEMKTSLLSWLNPEADAAEEAPVPVVEVEAPKTEAYSLNTTKTSTDQAFEDLFK